jgi:protein SCO1/2
VNRVIQVFFLLFVSAGVYAQPAVDSEAPFDRKQALAISQGAIGHILNDYHFVNNKGEEITLSGLRGKPLVISLIFTSCHHICPTTTQHLKKVAGIAREALGEDSFNVLSIGFDTANDSPEAMASFARQQGVDMPGWYFVSIDAASIKALTKETGFLYVPTARGFDHLIQATVVDADGKIYRQVYGMNFDVPKLVEPLKELVYGRPRQGELLAHLGDRIRLFCTVYDPTTDSYVFDYSIFIGMLIGLTSMLAVAWFVFREWRRHR